MTHYGSGRLVVTDAHVNAALDELFSEGMMPPSGCGVWAVTVSRQRRSYPGR